ncbi:MAG: adenosine-specific kinase, partial [Synergistaceae bacterium]|nr:adenosine-specific kinase [Synergistaceae bacterium]
MPEIQKWELVLLDFPSDCNIILGQSHFIKTVEDLFEALATSSPAL